MTAPGASDSYGEPRTIKVTFSDACSDVLLFLAKQAEARSPVDIARAVAPPAAVGPLTNVNNALRTLSECGLVEPWQQGPWRMWALSAEGRAFTANVCRHCGSLPEADGDHSCPCPYRDDECPDHPERTDA